MRKIYNDSIKHKILLSMRNYGDIKRSATKSYFGEYNRNTVEVAVKYLIEHEYIEEYKMPPKPRYAPVRYLKISEKGKDILKEIEALYGKTLPNVALVGIRREERKELVFSIYSVCQSYGVLTETEDKPPLEYLLLRSDKALTKREKEKFNQMNKKGAFYSMSEIRDITKREIGEGPMNQTRCIGIIVRHRNIFFIYNTGNRLIYFNRTVEIRTRDFILNNMQQSQIANQYINFNLSQRAPCIIFGDTYSVIPKLVFGRKQGEQIEAITTKEKKAEQLRKSKINDTLTLEALSFVFSEVYFIPFRYAGTVFETVTQMTPSYKKNVIDKWVSLQDVLRRVEDNSGAHAEVKRGGAYVFLWADNNLCDLEKIKRIGTSVNVIIPIKGAENAISRILGPSLISIKTMTGENLEIKRYNRNGNLIESEVQNDSSKKM